MKTKELIERGFAALPPPSASPTIQTTPKRPAAAAAPLVTPSSAEGPVVKTNPVPEQSSTAKDQTVIFRVIPPEKKP